MLVTKAISPLRIGPVHFQCLRSFSSTSAVRKLQLAYDHYPAAEGATTKNAPIVFIHGLFGSKKNNRSMSKYGLRIYHYVYSLTSDRVFARDLKRDVYAIVRPPPTPHSPAHH